MSQKLSLGNFKWVEDISGFNEDFIKSYNDKIYFLEVNGQYHENLHNLHIDLPFT